MSDCGGSQGSLVGIGVSRRLPFVSQCLSVVPRTDQDVGTGGAPRTTVSVAVASTSRGRDRILTPRARTVAPKGFMCWWRRSGSGYR